MKIDPPSSKQEKMQALREVLQQKNLDAFLVPRADAWPGEFVSSGAERLAWLSGFTGSAGTGIVTQEKAVVLTDGRYFSQIQYQLEPDLWTFGSILETSPESWLLENLTEEDVVGYDSWLHTLSQIRTMQTKLGKRDIKLIPVQDNPVDVLWADKPGPPRADVTVFQERLAGLSRREKLDQISGIVRNAHAQACLFAMPDSVAWLLNIRGGDVPNVPVPLSYAILFNDGSLDWFLPPEKVPQDLRNTLGSVVRIASLEDIESWVSKLSGPVLLDPDRTPEAFAKILDQHKIPHRDLEDPVLLPRACKTQDEQDSLRTAHIYDARAMEGFHKWLKTELSKQTLNEVQIASELENFRKEQPGYVMPSFETIAGFNANGAIVHYSATNETSAVLSGAGLLLVDSGGQYYSEEFAGTTDVTRTYAVGKPSREQRHHYTLVLRAHIQIANAEFPYGTRGIQIDALAREILWQENLDFPHGTGHGVGCFLNVHEEGGRLSVRDNRVLEPGMLLSNEPGLYFEGQYGIRLENLVLVQQTGKQDNLGRQILCFETVTLVPFEENLIDPGMLNDKEKSWLESYHEMIKNRL